METQKSSSDGSVFSFLSRLFHSVDNIQIEGHRTAELILKGLFLVLAMLAAVVVFVGYLLVYLIRAFNVPPPHQKVSRRIADGVFFAETYPRTYRVASSNKVTRRNKFFLFGEPSTRRRVNPYEIKIRKDFFDIQLNKKFWRW